MSVRLISAIPAEPGYTVSIKEFNAWHEPEPDWGDWEPVLAWGFSEDGATIPLTFNGVPPDHADWRIKNAAGVVIL